MSTLQLVEGHQDGGDEAPMSTIPTDSLEKSPFSDGISATQTVQFPVRDGQLFF